MITAFILVVSLLLPLQDTYLSREAGYARLGEVFLPPEGAERQENEDGTASWYYYTEHGVYDVKISKSLVAIEIEQYVMQTPRESALRIRKGIRDTYSRFLVDSSDNGEEFTDIYQDPYTRWEVSYGNVEQFTEVLHLRMKDLAGQPKSSEKPSDITVNLDILFDPYGDDFPTGIGGVNIGMELVTGDSWTLAKTKNGERTFEYRFESGDYYTVVVDDQYNISLVAYVIRSQPATIKEYARRYLVGKYGKYLQYQSDKGDYLQLPFKKQSLDKIKGYLLNEKKEGDFLKLVFSNTASDGGSTVLELIAFQNIINIIVKKPVSETSENPPAEKESPVVKSTYVDSLVMTNFFNAPAGALANALGPVKLGDVFEPGEIWKLTKTEAGLKYYQYRDYDNDDYTEVRVDDQNTILSVQHNFLDPTREFRKKVWDHVRSRFDSFKDETITNSDGTITYYLQRSSGVAAPISMAIYEFPDALVVRIFYGEL